ncbi:MAG: T9SS type A sorting domain-containing protein, partial [Bacteroidales bacterium]|nr:T9SS type A sorting domain-containing protein [Bacteroidales bacterium]
ITQPDVLSLSGVELNVSCNGLANGAVDLSISGGTMPFDIAWSNNEIIEDIDNLAAGTYSVTVIDGNGCATDASFTITQPDPLVLSGLESNISCNGLADGAIDLSISGGTLPFDILWSNNEITEDLDNLLADTYSVSVEDAGGCIANASFTLTQPDLLDVSYTSTNANCYGQSNGSINITTTGGMPNYSYLWGNGATSEDRTSIPAGTYSLTVSDASNCMATLAIVVSQPDVVSYAAQVTNVSCNGANNGSIALAPSGGTSPYTYLWLVNATTSGINNLGAGSYSVLITDNHNCLLTAGFTVTQPNALTLSLSADDVSCSGGSNGAITSVATGGTGTLSYLWSNGETTENLSNVSAGSYSLTISDANACSIDASITVNEPQVIEILVNSTNPLCDGDQNGSIGLSVTGGVSPYSILWSNTETDALIEGLVAGEYCVTVTDFNSCMATVCVTLTEPNPLTLVLVGNDLTCFESNNGSIGAVVSGGTQGYSYLWSDGGTNQNIEYLEAGVYSLTVSDANSCIASGETTLNQPLQIIVDAGNDITINAGETTTIAATSGFVSYLWSNGETDLSIDISDEGSYIVTVTDFMGCEGIDSMYLTLNPFIVQELVLDSGWSMFSLYVIPPDPDISVVFADVANHVSIAKNSAGQSWWPIFNLNLIGDIIVDEGYALNMLAADTLYVEGLIVDPETTPVIIPVDWSYITYLRQTPGNAVEMLSPIVSSISLLKNDQGQMYWPYFGFNLIGDMMPGEGYQIKMTSQDTLYYPPNTITSAKTIVYNPRPEKYQIDINTANNMTLGIPETAWVNLPDEGDEIGIFNRQEELAGAAVFTGGHTAISIWGDDQITDRKELFSQGEKFEIRVWNTISETEEVLEVASWIEGSNKFSENGIAIVDKFVKHEIQQSGTSLNQNYPNPFNRETQISFTISEESLVHISLFNALGEEVAAICHSQFNAGGHQLTFDGSKLPSGIYMYRMETKNNSLVRQMNILH